jgi:L-cysteine desulfidase
MILTAAALGALVAAPALAQGTGPWGKVGEQGSSVTYIDMGSISGPETDKTAVTIAISKVSTVYTGEQTRWSFNCSAHTYRGTGYRDVETDLSTGDFSASDEPAERVAAGSMLEAISQAVCDGATSDETHATLAEAVTATRAAP